MAWQKSTDFGLRALAETAVSRVKRLNANQLRSRTFGAQQKEIAFQISALNRMIRAGKPNTIRVV
jgi:hypothetical protein